MNTGLVPISPSITTNNTWCYFNQLENNDNFKFAALIHAVNKNCTGEPFFRSIVQLNPTNRESKKNEIIGQDPLGNHRELSCAQWEEKFNESFFDDDYEIKGEREFGLAFKNKDIFALTCDDVLGDDFRKMTNKLKLQESLPEQQYNMQESILRPDWVHPDDPKGESSSNIPEKIGYFTGGLVSAIALMGAIGAVFKKRIAGLFARSPQEKTVGKELLPLRKEGRVLQA